MASFDRISTRLLNTISNAFANHANRLLTMGEMIATFRNKGSWTLWSA
jgi:hypothetical protein